jgi:Na+/proline symporter
VKGKVENYCVAGKTFPAWMVAITLSAAAVDSNLLLGNVDLSYKYSWWDGAVLPMATGFHLFINTLPLAAKINSEPHTLTVPDIIGNRFGKVVETLCSIVCIVSFLMLLAGNLVGMGVINSYVWDTSFLTGIWLSAAVIWTYTVVGGLFSVATTDVVQGAIGWYVSILILFLRLLKIQSTTD